MKIDRFDMERLQCIYESQVEFNLSESGVLPMRVEELIEGTDGPDWLNAQSLKYPPSDGSDILRERIGRFYGDATAANVMVTNGGSEANYITLWSLLERGDRVAVMIPNYLQAWGLARAYGGRADAFRLIEKREDGRPRWGLDLEGLRRAVTKKTRIIVVTNPNNPTGAVLTENEMDAVIKAARRVNAWILSDEIYRGAEVTGPTSPTFWGRYRKTLITAGLSKAFGLPGLRIGWIIGPPVAIEKFHHYQDYISVTPTILSDRLAAIAMEPARREAILDRTRRIIRSNLGVLEEWVRGHEDILSYIPPRAGAIALMGYRLPVASEALFTRLLKKSSVLINTGAHFGIRKYIRIGYGYDVEQLKKGLGRLSEAFEQLRQRQARPLHRAGRRAVSGPVA